MALRDGEGVEKNSDAALRLFLNAAAKGHGGAEYSAGCMYASGNGIELNLVRALKCFERAAERGYKNARTITEKLRTKLDKKRDKYKLYGGGLYAQRVEVVDPLAMGLTEAYAAGLAVSFDYKNNKFQIDLDSGNVVWLSSTHCVEEGLAAEDGNVDENTPVVNSRREPNGAGSSGPEEKNETSCDDTTYLTKQIITYMGNKRKMLSAIDEQLTVIQGELGREKLTIGDGFSGSGIVSRLFKRQSSALYTNDIAGYSKTLNECYLSTPTQDDMVLIHQYIDTANNLNFEDVGEPWISRHWAPPLETISIGDRVYFTHRNGKRIDAMRDYIAEYVPSAYQPYLLAPLLVMTSIHNNTSGQFAAFYKDGKDKGAYGGKNHIDIKRITQDIVIPYPVFSEYHCDTSISQMDTNEWVKTLPELDVVYYDPPYNKHPYNIYYFLLDIVNNWDKTQEIPDTNRGQPKNWDKSRFNSYVHAKNAVKDLIENTRAKYLILSYSSSGIIPIIELEELLTDCGELTKVDIEHKTYNRLRGMSNYKRTKERSVTKELLYILKKV